jgi:hypothetical protein
MAKPAKSVEAEVSDKDAKKFVAQILAHFDNIESARGTYMNRARRERDGMTAIYESMAARGVPQKSAKTNIKIIRLLQKAKALMAELEADEAKMAKKLAKAQGDKQQLLLWNDLPSQDKPKKEKRQPKEAAPESGDKEWAEAEPAGRA